MQCTCVQGKFICVYTYTTIYCFYRTTLAKSEGVINLNQTYSQGKNKLSFVELLFFTKPYFASLMVAECY